MIGVPGDVDADCHHEFGFHERIADQGHASRWDGDGSGVNLPRGVEAIYAGSSSAGVMRTAKSARCLASPRATFRASAAANGGHDGGKAARFASRYGTVEGLLARRFPP